MGTTWDRRKDEREDEVEEKNREERKKVELQEKTKIPLPEDRLIWTNAETKGQIKKLENQIDVVSKRMFKTMESIVDIRNKLESSKDLYTNEQDYVGVQDILIKAKSELNILINNLSFREKFYYFISIWGIIPILTAIFGLIVSFWLLQEGIGNLTIMDVPVWASLFSVIGGSVQILVGVVKDYKDDGMITFYKRLWYIVILPASFAFGFIAYLFIVAGLLNITQGQIVLNLALNQTIVTTTQIGNQTITKTTSQSGTISNLAVPIIVCFLAGYATEWFMGLLGKITTAGVTGK